jgi:NAD(P)-dependent dehydrogenase (short-subunit alcohol dehydrogenase family)
VRIVNSIPLRRQAAAREIAEGMFFLAPPEASFVTGTWLVVNGGAVLRQERGHR